MSLVTLEHGRVAYALDFIAIAAAGVSLGAVALATEADLLTDPAGEPGSALWLTVLLALAGLLAWTLIEYTVHRFVLHGLQPFRRWHTLHHQRPGACIYAPTWLSCGFIGLGVLLPLWLLADLHVAAAAGFGFVLGNLVYALSHHVAHRTAPRPPPSARDDGSAVSSWRQRVHDWHTLHHGSSRATAQFGVSTRLWDYVFGTERARPVRRRYRSAA